jgi:hypothetical protein
MRWNAPSGLSSAKASGHSQTSGADVTSWNTLACLQTQPRRTKPSRQLRFQGALLPPLENCSIGSLSSLCSNDLNIAANRPL